MAKKILGIAFFPTLLKSLLTGLAYTIALILGGILVSSVGLELPQAKDAVEKVAWSFAGGVIAGLSLGPIAANMPIPRTRHLIVWSSLLFLNLASVVFEGFFFAPDVIGNGLLGLLAQQFLASFGSAWMITMLYAPKVPIMTPPSTKRSGFSWVWRIMVSALMYVSFYYFFGTINYLLVTKPYYETHAGGLEVPALPVTLAVEILRGVLIALSVLPYILSASSGHRRFALQTGLILFAVGGLVPLTMQVGVLPLLLLAASGVEIFFQNFLTGIVIARFLSTGHRV